MRGQSSIGLVSFHFALCPFKRGELDKAAEPFGGKAALFPLAIVFAVIRHYFFVSAYVAANLVKEKHLTYK